MVSRELAKRREQALRVSSGEDRWEFSLLLTPEYFGTLRRLATMQSENQDAEADFRAFWQRVRAALDAAKATPFD
jgi:hypothetical protein